MTDVTITVRGEHESRVPPEQAVAFLTVQAEGRERGTVVELIAAYSTPVRDDLEARKTAGGVVEWSSQRVSVWSQRPWNADGKRLAPVHYASVEFTATFSDFAALSYWAGEVVERDGVQLGHIDWRLTPATRTRVEQEVAAAAVGSATARATAYASALGLASVTPVEVADLGLLTRHAGPEVMPVAPMMMSARSGMAADKAAGPPVQLQPEDLVITAAVEARYRAS